MTPASAAFAASLMGAAGMIGRLGMGYLLDLLPAERVPTIAFSVIAAGIFLLFAGATGGSAYLAAILIGIGYGSETATVPYLVGDISGCVRSAKSTATFYSRAARRRDRAVVDGSEYDRTGSYHLSLLFCAVATVVAALALLRLKSYPAFSKNPIIGLIELIGPISPISPIGPI